MPRIFLSMIAFRAVKAPFAMALLIGSATSGAESPAPAAVDDPFPTIVAPFLKTHCVKCHGPDKQSGGLRVDDMAGEAAKDRDRWEAIRDQLRDGQMPPPKEPRPDKARARAVVAWATVRTGASAARLPNQGNLIPHELLFGKLAAASELPPGRVWRLSPAGYMGFARGLMRGKTLPGVIQPFTVIPERGIKDFAGLYSIDEPSTEILVRNAEAIVEAQTGHEIKDGKVSGKGDSIPEFVVLMNPAVEPTRSQLESAVQTQFRLAIDRTADADDVARFVGLYEKCAKNGDRPDAIKIMLQAVLLRTDAMFRGELGRVGADSSGLGRLSPWELARAVNLSLSDRREPGITIMHDTAKGDLATREQIAAHVRRILDDPKIEKPRLMQFFREYFEYGKAVDVFKDKPEDVFKEDPERFKHEPAIYVSDTDRLIEHILAEDKDVFRRLLTTPDSFVNYALRKDKATGRTGPVQAAVEEAQI